MAGWGDGPFDDDDAADFLGDLADGEPADAADAVAAVLGTVIGVGGYVESAEMSRALAAAAVVALSLDPSLPTPSSLPRRWVAALPPAGAALVAAAAATVERAFDPADNEWFDRWDETGRLDEVRRRLAPYRALLVATG
jgi:hypothetical protein